MTNQGGLLPERMSQACLLCEHQELRVINFLSGRQLRELWRVLGRSISWEAFSPIQAESTINLNSCCRCGFRFFDPRLAGSGRFYEELNQTGYYSGSRPEFHRTIAFARKHGVHTLLDVGCGEGAFLDLARSAGLRVSGVELNPAAASFARSKSHEIFQELPHTPPLGMGYDLITLFQVLEHLPRPLHLLQALVGLLKPGGWVSLAVPNDQGIYRLAPWDPHQWPPHHISRWRRKDFQVLAEKSGLKLIASGGDSLLGTALESLWRQHLKLQVAIDGCERPEPGWLAGACYLYRKLGLRHFLPGWGNSLFAYFQKM